jgi:hypothetical protein
MAELRAQQELGSAAGTGLRQASGCVFQNLWLQDWGRGSPKLLLRSLYCFCHIFIALSRKSFKFVLACETPNCAKPTVSLLSITYGKSHLLSNAFAGQFLRASPGKDASVPKP